MRVNWYLHVDSAMLSRRNFMSGTAAVGITAFRNDTIARLISAEPSLSMGPREIAEDETYWAKVRLAFDIEPTFLYLNNGGVCPAPRAVRAAEQAYLDEAAKAPAYYLFRKHEHRIEEVRTRLAKLFQASPEEIAIMPNASQGLFTTIMGVQMGEGDHLVASSQDYPRVLTAVNQRARRDKVTLTIVDHPEVPKTDDELIKPITQTLSSKPKLVCFPRVGFANGTFFPAKSIADSCRSAGTLTLVDGAHAIGQVADTVSTVGSDFYACCLHKWILGPTGTGFLYVRRDLIPEVWPLNPADDKLDHDIRKFEQFGTRNTGVLLSISDALDAHEAIGQERKSARLEYLRTYLIHGLKPIPGLEFGSPLSSDLAKTLLAVRILNTSSVSLANWLMTKHKIFVTTTKVGSFDAIRITPQIFTTPSELDQLIKAVADASANGLL